MEEGYNPAYGARPLRRAIMRLLEDSMAERMLSGDIKEGDSVIIDVDADGQVRGMPYSYLGACFTAAAQTCEVLHAGLIVLLAPAWLSEQCERGSHKNEGHALSLAHRSMQVSVLNGDKKMTAAVDATPAGIS